ncbi:MAG: response regulator transcription factor [Acidobacteria bacterium]|nr:response regulator transcription factor [Acidobacteriota bacterium]
MSVIIARENNTREPYTVHILRPVDVRKRLELAVRDFLITEVSLPQEKAAALVRTTRSGVSETELTAREREVLKLLATGQTSPSIAKDLHISRNTADNHIQHILKKLNAHSRLEAVRRAELAGLI